MTYEICNTQTDLPVAKDEDSPTYYNLIKTVVSQRPKDGFDDIEDMRLRLDIVDRIEGVPIDSMMHFSSAEYAKVCDLLTEMKWNLLDRSILNFIDAITNAEKLESDD